MASASRSSTRSPSNSSSTVKREGKIWRQTYERGAPDAPLEVIGEASDTGTRITFHPDPQIFAITEFSFDVLSKRLRELSFLNAGVRIVIEDERNDKRHDFCYEGGIISFVEHLNEKRQPLHEAPIFVSDSRPLTEQGRQLRGRCRNRAPVQRLVQRSGLLVREQHQYDRGRHPSHRIPDGADPDHQPLHRSEHYKGSEQGSKTSPAVTGDDLREGLTAVISRQASAARVRGPDEDEARDERGSRHRRGDRLPAADELSSRRIRASRSRSSPRSSTRRGPRGGPQGPGSGTAQGRALGLQPARQARRLPGARSRRNASSSSSRVIPPAAPRSRAAPARPRRSCRSAARSSTSNERESIACSRAPRSRPSSPHSVPGSARTSPPTSPATTTSSS